MYQAAKRKKTEPRKAPKLKVKVKAEGAAAHRLLRKLGRAEVSNAQ